VTIGERRRVEPLDRRERLRGIGRKLDDLERRRMIEHRH